MAKQKQNIPEGVEVIVTAKCPKCKKKRDYVMPIQYTPYCDVCLTMPMVAVKVEIKQIKVKQLKSNGNNNLHRNR